MKVVIDTNIFVSGIFWKGSPHQVLLAWRQGRYTLITSVDILSEISKVLNDFEIKLPKEMINEWIELIIKNSIIVEPKEKIQAVKEDPKDDMFIEAAVTAKADYVISGDKHLLKLKQFGDTKIISASQFNEICNFI
ncbi:putative toxin-antitoxin system toxin component, PIN family [Candidatus Woesearchaeota archaeon]|nr:putative toxin-antitoxin system toxin component, PIN family [Candidatus Woesearchaeota archaeon]